MSAGIVRFQNLVAIGVVLLVACLVWFFWPESEPDLVLYCGVDQDQSRLTIKYFENESGLKVDFHGESEAFRSIGLPQKLLRERDNPRADVYWSNEIMHMAHLADLGLFATLPADVVEAFPEQWRDPDAQFIQFGARARVLLVNTELLTPEQYPTSVQDLYDPKWKAMGLHTCMAAPLTGTTYTHAVALLTEDEAAGKAFFDRCAEAMNSGLMKVVASNGRVMRAVSDAEQKVAFGLTDTDDAWIAIKRGDPVVVVYPDQAPEQPGTVIIPNTAAILKGAKRASAADRFMRWLASEPVETMLAESASAQMPVRATVEYDAPHVKRPGQDFRVKPVDWRAVGKNVDRWRDHLNRQFRPVQ